MEEPSPPTCIPARAAHGQPWSIPEWWGCWTSTYSPSFSSCVYTSETCSWLLMTTSQYSNVSSPPGRDGAEWFMYGSLMLWGPAACTRPQCFFLYLQLPPGSTTLPMASDGTVGGHGDRSCYHESSWSSPDHGLEGKGAFRIKNSRKMGPLNRMA